MVLIYYCDLLSQPCRAVWLFMKKNGIPFEEKYIDLLKGEHKKEEFSAKNSQQLVPLLEDTDENFILTESVAMLKYLAEKFEVEDHWYPRDLKKRAKVDEYCAWQHINARWKSAYVFLNETIRPGMYTKRGDLVKEMNDMLDVMESFFLKDNKFIAGSELSIADLLGVCELYQVFGTGRDFLNDNNNNKLIAWMDRVKHELNPFYDEANQTLDELAIQFREKRQ